MTAKLRKDGQPKQAGGPRLKVREDDMRGMSQGEHGHQLPHIPSEETRDLVRRYAVTLTIPKIAKLIGVHRDTLVRHYADEIEIAVIDAEEKIGSGLYKSAMDGHFPSRVFWLQTRAKWTRKIDIGLGGPNGGPVDMRILEGLSDEQLAILEQAAASLAGLDDAQPEGGTGGDPGD